MDLFNGCLCSMAAGGCTSVCCTSDNSQAPCADISLFCKHSSFLAGDGMLLRLLISDLVVENQIYITRVDNLMLLTRKSH